MVSLVLLVLSLLSLLVLLLQLLLIYGYGIKCFKIKLVVWFNIMYKGD